MTSPPAAWRLQLRDRPGAVERLLSVLRRRMVPIEALALARSGEGGLTVDLTLALPPDRRDRIAAEVSGLADVEECVTNPSHPNERTDEHARRIVDH